PLPASLSRLLHRLLPTARDQRAERRHVRAPAGLPTAAVRAPQAGRPTTEGRHAGTATSPDLPLLLLAPAQRAAGHQPGRRPAHAETGPPPPRSNPQQDRDDGS